MFQTRRVLLLLVLLAAPVFYLAAPVRTSAGGPTNAKDTQAPTADFSADRVEIRPRWKSTSPTSPRERSRHGFGISETDKPVPNRTPPTSSLRMATTR